MGVTSAYVLGLIVVFVVGAGVTFVVMDFVVLPLAKRIRKRRGPTSYWDEQTPYNLTEKNIERIAWVGGGITLALAVLLIFSVPKETAFVILCVLGVIGILAGLLSFELFK
jgi:hypothetical protein